MSTVNPFDLLGDDDAEDPSQLIAAKKVVAVKAPPPTKKGPAQTKSAALGAQPNKPASLPSKPLPPAQAVREARNEGGRGGRGSGRGGGRGNGRGREGGSFSRDSFNNENSSAPVDGEAGKATERREYSGPRGRGGRRGGFNNGEGTDGERPRRVYERHSGTGRENEFKREGSGRGNWGRPTDEFAEVSEEAVNETEKSAGDEKPVQEDDAGGVNTENSAKEPEETEPEDKEMTLEEYEKLLEEKRKALLALKTEERKVDPKEFASMQQISSKKENNEIFAKLGSEKDKRKEIADKEERTKKSLSINEFLKPVEGERHYAPGGRGRGRGRGSRGGGYSGISTSHVAAPSIEDPGQFPTLGAK